MGEPIPSKWLSPGFDELVAEFPELVLAYDYPSYPGAMAGAGRWVDLYYGDTPVGRLWTNDRDACGIDQLPGCNTDLYTREVLQLRLFHHARVPCTRAYRTVSGRYRHGPDTNGDLRAADATERW